MRILSLIVLTFFTAIALAANNTPWQPVEAAQPAFNGGLNGKQIKACDKQMASVCTDKNPFANMQCLQTNMAGKASCLQSLAFLNLTNGTPAKIKHYKNVDVVLANVAAADHSQDFFMISHAGELVRLNGQIDITNVQGYEALIKKFPKLMLLPTNATGKFPGKESLPDGSDYLVFKQLLVNGCVACERAGSVEVAYVFGKDGKFVESKAIKFSKQK